MPQQNLSEWSQATKAGETGADTDRDLVAVNRILGDFGALVGNGRAVLIGLLIDGTEWTDDLLDLCFTQIRQEQVDKIVNWFENRANA